VNGTTNAIAPRGGDLAVVPMPEVGCDERQQRDRQQQSGERYAPDERQLHAPFDEQLAARGGGNRIVRDGHRDHGHGRPDCIRREHLRRFS
jgi:hypothetical protein